MGRRLFISNSEIGKFTRKILMFLGIFWVLSTAVYGVVNYMYFHSYGGNSGAQINHVIQSEYDAYVFGASRAVHHYDTGILSKSLGLRCFNAGDDGKNATYQLGLLKMLLEKHKPKLIIYEIGDLSTTLNGGTVDLYPYYYRYKDVRHLLIERDPWVTIKLLFPLYAYNRKVFSVTKSYLHASPPSKTGFRPLKGSMLPAEVEKYNTQSKQAIELAPIDSKAKNSFHEFVTTCKRAHIALVFCYSPTYMPHKPAGLQYIKDVAAQAGISLYLYGEDGDFNYHPELFKDASHLNTIGAEKFTKLFVQSVMTKNLIIPKSTNKAIRS